MRLPLLRSAVVFVSAMLAFARPAAASVSVAGGVFSQDKPSQTGTAVIVSSGASIPAVPLEIQGSFLVPLTPKGGYAATAEIRGFTGGGKGGAYIGAGAGVGNLSSDRSQGPVFTVFAGKSIAPFTSIEVRLYKGSQNTAATAGFIGLRFAF